MFEQMIPLAEFDSEFEAEIACGHLKSAGIDAIILKDDAGDMSPSLQEMEGVHVLVPKDQEEDSRRILDEKKMRKIERITVLTSGASVNRSNRHRYRASCFLP